MTRHQEAGFTLIEALIALLVLSLGLLGVAAMQLKAMQSAQVSYQRTIATIAAQDAVERLWSEMKTEGGELTCPDTADTASVQSDWFSSWSLHFNVFDGSNINPGANCHFDVAVRWADDRFTIDGEENEKEEVSTLEYSVRLPGI